MDVLTTLNPILEQLGISASFKSHLLAAGSVIPLVKLLRMTLSNDVLGGWKTMIAAGLVSLAVTLPLTAYNDVSEVARLQWVSVPLVWMITWGLAMASWSGGKGAVNVSKNAVNVLKTGNGSLGFL